MRSRPSFWVLICLLLAAGAWLLWRASDRTAEKISAMKQIAAPERKIAASDFARIISASTAPNVFPASLTSTNAAQTSASVKTNKFAYRLTNTRKTIGELTSDPHAILLANALIDTGAKLDLSIPKSLQSAGDPGAYVVQANGPINNAFRAMLADAGAQIVSYIPNNAYLVTVSADGADKIIASGFPVFRNEPYYKVSPTLLEAILKNPDQSLAANQIRVAAYPNTTDAARTALEKMGASVVAQESSPFGEVFTVQNVSDVAAVARSSAVQLVEPFHTRAIANDLARVMLGISTNTTTAANYLGLNGKNVIVEVNDTGIDATHPDFSATGTAMSGPSGSSRVMGDAAQSLVDTDGHGTHVAGIIAGNGSESHSVTNIPQGSVTNADFRGKAPLAKLYSVGGVFGGADTNIFGVTNVIIDRYFQEAPARTNALISNNSWGYVNDSDYDLAAASYDAAVRDALPQVTGSQPVLFVFAAGNSGGGDDDGGGGASDTISSPATAKNVISVGALEQLRNITNIVTDINGNSNAIWQPQTDSSSQVAGYSSRGNVGVGTEGANGRFKPDVVAPGSFVVSTRSQQWDQAAYYNPTNFYDDELLNQTIAANATQHDSVSLNFFPPNVTFNSNIVAVTIQIIPESDLTNIPNLLIYVSHINYPVPGNSGTYDFVTANNKVSIPNPDGGSSYLSQIQGGNLFLTIVNTNNERVDYDFFTEIVATNQLGNYFQVLSNLNNTIGPYYRYESGTSMAAPAVSGTLALMQDYFTNTLHQTPSPALLKAMLINGARPVGNYSYAVGNGLNFEGWGLVSLPDSLPDGITNQSTAPCSSFFLDQSPTNALATGDSQTFMVSVDPDSFGQAFPLQVTLAWTDPAGDPAAAIKLVNNLDLVITNLDTGDVNYQSVYFGNDIIPGNTFNLAWDTNTAPNLDSINNMENIILPPLLGASYSVTVVGRSVNVNAVSAQTNSSMGNYAPNVVQDFALVISCGEGEVPDAITVTPLPVVSNPTADQQITFVAVTNTPLFNQFVGANTPLLGTNQVQLDSSNELVTLGMTNQWHFYVVTNEAMDASNNVADVTNAAFITFLPDTLSIPRMGVFQEDDPANATRPEADIDMYVTTDSNLLVLDPTTISNCVNGTQIGASAASKFNGASLGRGGTEFVVDTNSTHGQIYYIGVKSEDQNASEFGFLSVFTSVPFSQIGSNGNETVNGFPLPVNIPDGSPAHPGSGYVFGLALQPMVIQNVAVSNQIVHQNFGDLIGTLNHDGTSDVLNNHDSLGNPPGPYGFIYDDSGTGQNPGSQPSDGPGSLQNYTGKQAIGPWILTEVDDSLTQTGSVTAFSLTIQPHRDLQQPGIDVLLQPHGSFSSFVDVPVGYTNLIVAATNISVEQTPSEPLATPPLELFVGFNAMPSTSTNGVSLTNSPTGLPYPTGADPGNAISIGPPLEPGRYFVTVTNPSASQQEVFIVATLSFSASAISTVDFHPSGSTAILDDAVTYSSIFVTNTDIIQDFSVGLRVDHPRISDLVFHLISPDGTRYLLMENRGGTSTNGAGLTLLNPNTFAPVSSSGGPEPQTNIVDTGVTGGTVQIDYDFLALPDEMTIYYEGNQVFDSGMISSNGTFFIDYGPGASTQLTIIMNQNTNPMPTTAWTYTVHAVETNYLYLAFTEDTNLTTTPIKFAVPPFIPNTNTSIIFTDSFETVTATNYFAGQSFGNGWAVVTNQVSVLTDPTLPFQGSNFLALANGVISNTLPTVTGKTYVLSFNYRGPGIAAWWRGESNTVDSIYGNNGKWVNGAAYTSPSEVGSSFNLNGINNYVLVNPATPHWGFGQTSGFTIEGWINPMNVQPGIMTEFEKVLGTSSSADVSIDFSINGGGPGSIDANVKDTANGDHTFYAPNGTVSVGSWQHVAVSYNKVTGIGTFYHNGVMVMKANLGLFTPGTDFTNLLIGARTTFINPNDMFPGGIDEISMYDRPLSDSEIFGIYQKGSNGKFDPTEFNLSPAQSLAKAQISIDGGTPTAFFGDNTNWQTKTITFTATQDGTPLTLAGVEPGILLDNFSVKQTPGNLYYLPEQDISALNGQSAFGTWQLEIQDDRAGAGLTNSLLSWQLEFEFANFAPSPSPLTNNTPLTNVVPANSISWFSVNVPLNADIATNLLLFATAPVNLLFNQNTPDTNGDFTLLANSTFGSTNLSASSSPPLVPGQTYFLGVQNTNNFAVTNAIEVIFHLLASGAPFAFTQPATLVTGTGAQLNGMATPNGFPATAWFQWGTNTLYGNQTPPVNVGSGFNVVYTNSQIPLIRNVPYHFRLVVSNAFAVTFGFDQILDEANVVAWGANYAGQINVPAGLSNAVAIAGAYDHSLALKTNELAVAWGDNTFGQTSVPAGLTNVVAVAGGQYYSLALKSNGSVSSWGANILNQTNVPAGLNNVVTIAGGTYSSLALKNDGSVVAWGANFFNLTNVPASATNTVAIASGSYHSLALKNDGTITVWGDDSSGQTNVPAGLSNVVAIAGGNFHSLALKYDGTVVAWGDDGSGQTNVPVGLSNVVAIAAGGFHSLALKADGSIVAWGDNSAGQKNVPAGLTNFVAIAAGNFHSLALTPQSIVNLTNVVLNLASGTPQTGNVLPGGIVYYRVNVPANADFATNTLLFALNGTLNIWFSTNTPPTVGAPNDTLLLNNVTNGISVLSTNGIPPLVPGSTYYLGVQNTNNVTVNYGIEVDFHLVTSASPTISISSITYTNINGTNGFFLIWFAPSNDLFQVQYKDDLGAPVWNTFTNIISYDPNVFTNPTNTQFDFFDDGSQTPPGLPPDRFYRLILLATNTLTLPSQSNYVATVSVPLAVTNTATDSNPSAILTYALTNFPATSTVAMIDTNGIITWTPGPADADNEFKFTTVVTDNGAPPLSATNSFTVFVVQPSSTFPSITNVSATATQVTLQWAAPTNDLFQVDWATNLMPVIVWTPFPGTITSTTGTFIFMDTNAPLATKFYRLEWLPLP